ncbi:MAG: hypothetical protein V7704_08385 [Aurantimonas endophytica]|uniref:hypothetical protein n=1 Tax=Aurantimonas endophytica TaxID=1522175 RepID=UPI003002A67A
MAFTDFGLDKFKEFIADQIDRRIDYKASSRGLTGCMRIVVSPGKELEATVRNGPSGRAQRLVRRVGGAILVGLGTQLAL